jgi:hypothetical protein
MTYQFRALSDIEDDIEHRYSIAGVAARHPSARIRQLFNVAWQETREIVALAGDGSWLKATTTASLPTSAAVTDETYAEIDWPIGAVGVYGVRVQIGSGRWYPLKRIPWAAYQDYQYSGFFESLSSARNPVAYIPRILPEGGTATESVGKVMIVPVPTSGSYRLWYLEAWAPQTGDTFQFAGHSEFIEHAILGTLIKMLQPDGDMNGQYGIWSKERERIEARIESRARRLDGGTSMEPRDARGDGIDPEQWGEW